MWLFHFQCISVIYVILSHWFFFCVNLVLYCECTSRRTLSGGNNRIPFLRWLFKLNFMYVCCRCCIDVFYSDFYLIVNFHTSFEFNMLIYFVECVSKIKHILSVIHHTIYGAVCFQFIHFPCDDWENIYFVLSSTSEVRTIMHCLGLSHETMVCALCPSIFSWDNPHPSNKHHSFRYNVASVLFGWTNVHV